MVTHLENEIELVQEAQRGCCESFGILVEHYAQSVYRLGYTVTKNAADAEKILLDTFQRAHASIDQFDGESGICTWLLQIAMTEAVSKLCRHHEILHVALAEAAGTDNPMPESSEVQDWSGYPEETYGNSELRVLMSKKLWQLELGLRVVFLLRDVERLSSEDTARVLGISAQAVKDCLLRARLKLGHQLSDRLEDCSVLAW